MIKLGSLVMRQRCHPAVGTASLVNPVIRFQQLFQGDDTLDSQIGHFLLAAGKEMIGSV